MALIPIAGPNGLVWVDEDRLTPSEISRAGEHHAAIQAVTDGRDPYGFGLDDFIDEVIDGVPLVTDAARILDLDEEDKLTFEEFYEV